MRIAGLRRIAGLFEWIRRSHPVTRLAETRVHAVDVHNQGKTLCGVALQQPTEQIRSEPVAADICNSCLANMRADLVWRKEQGEA